MQLLQFASGILSDGLSREQRRNRLPALAPTFRRLPSRVDFMDGVWSRKHDEPHLPKPGLPFIGRVIKPNEDFFAGIRGQVHFPPGPEAPAFEQDIPFLAVIEPLRRKLPPSRAREKCSPSSRPVWPTGLFSDQT